MKKETKQEIVQQFAELMKASKTKQRSDITEEIVRKAIKMMKNKKAPDRQGWRAEWIKEEGPEMIKSITYILNEIEDKQTIPKQWNDISITSIPKKKRLKDPKGTILRRSNLQNLWKG